MKRKEIQVPFLSMFQARARLKLSLITMPEYSRMAITKSINEVELPLREVAKVSKQEAWSIYTRRLLSACRAELPSTTEQRRILNDYQILLNT